MQTPIEPLHDPEKLIATYQKLAYSFAYSYRNHGVPIEDLQQESLIGLLEAARRFDPSMNAKFSTYAVYWIKKYVLAAISKEHCTSLDATELQEKHLAHDIPALSLSDSMHDCCMESRLTLPDEIPALEKCVILLSYQQNLTIKEIATKLGLTNEKVKQLRSKALRRLRNSEVFQQLNTKLTNS
ncbi:MAG: sigma-70 family RNA polymerase sigma factor [Candidatus Cloacimonadaceae bacterium]|nr:sigma-70 family RNA polymerase sigma factor [Candidatus Cloacimonadaceae bacterium]